MALLFMTADCVEHSCLANVGKANDNELEVEKRATRSWLKFLCISEYVSDDRSALDWIERRQ